MHKMAAKQNAATPSARSGQLVTCLTVMFDTLTIGGMADSCLSPQSLRYTAVCRA